MVCTATFIVTFENKVLQPELNNYRLLRSCKLKLKYDKTLYAVKKQDARFSREGLDLSVAIFNY